MARPKKQSSVDSFIQQATESIVPSQEPIVETEAPAETYSEPVAESLPPVEEQPMTYEEASASGDLSYTDEELKAIESGWTPREVFHGDHTRWKDAKTWNERTHYNNSFDEQKRRIDELSQTQTEMLNMLREERARNATAQLVAVDREREEAIRMADVDKVKKLDDVIFSLRTIAGSVPQSSSGNIPTPPPAPVPMVEPPEIKSFRDRNKWFNGSDELSRRKTTYAQFLENDLNARKTPMSLSDKMAYIENEVKQIFDSPRRNISPVETRRTPMTQNSSNGGVPEYNGLPTEAKRYVDYFTAKAEFRAKQGRKTFDKDAYRSQYMKDLVKNNVIDSNGRLVPQKRG